MPFMLVTIIPLLSYSPGPEKNCGSIDTPLALTIALASLPFNLNELPNQKISTPVCYNIFVKLTMRLSATTFIISQVLILILGLGAIFGYNLLLNPGAQKPNSFARGPVTNAPASLTLEVTNPDDNLLTFNSSLIITGKTLPKLDILVTTDEEDLVVESKSDGTFSADLNLKLGVNEITIAVFDEVGNTREIKRTVYYSKEKI